MRSARRRLDELRIALMLLTRLPLGRIGGEAPGLADARWAYPLAGLVVGGLVWGGHSLAIALGLSSSVAAFCALAVAALVTGGLHHDGLADFADGIGGGRDPAHCLEIMRDSHIGSYGVLALILVLALMGTSIATLPPDTPTAAAFLFCAVASRLAMLAALEWLPPARDNGLGRSASRADPQVLLPGAIACAGMAWLIGPASLAALLSAAAALVVFGRAARRRIGGQTGDVLGAVQLCAETACWMALAARL